MTKKNEKIEVIKTEEQKQKLKQDAPFTMQQIREFKDEYREFVDKPDWFMGVGIGLDTKTVPYKQGIVVNYHEEFVNEAQDSIDDFISSKEEILSEEQKDKLKSLFTLRKFSEGFKAR